MITLETDEIVHIIERRFFADDVRRHFIGKVRAYDATVVRVLGYVWVYSSRLGKFVRRRERRERVFVLGDKLIINVLPRTVAVDAITYATDAERRMFLTDGKSFTLDLSEFVEIK